MAVPKLERLITLLDVLVSAARPLVLDDIRARVPGYPEHPESFRRAFERDKVELRDMGVPLETQPLTAPDGTPTTGYRVQPGAAVLQGLDLDAEEVRALRLAAAVVDAGEGGIGALLKIGGGITRSRPQVEMPTDPALVKLFEAVGRRRRVRFRYKDLDRTVDPYRVEYTRGRWYLRGHDHGRGEARSFRRDRIEGPVTVLDPDGAFERPEVAGDGIRRSSWSIVDRCAPVEVQIRFDPAVAGAVRREVGDARILGDDEDGLVVEVVMTDPDGFRSWVLSYLDQAEVLHPPSVRADIVDWLVEVSGG